MKHGEVRRIGNATILCHVHRMSWRSREDKWMGSLAPRHRSSRTTYAIVGPDGRIIAERVETYKRAVEIAESVAR